MFFVYVNNGTLLLPANIYGSEENVRLDFVTLDIDVRFTNYYMGKLIENVFLKLLLIRYSGQYESHQRKI